MNIAQYKPEKTAKSKRKVASDYSYFDVQEFVKNRKTEDHSKRRDWVLREESEYVPVPIPKMQIDKCSEKELDDLIKKIDKQIAELEAEEKREKTKASNIVRVVVTCKEEKVSKVAKIISSKTHNTYLKVKKELEQKHSITLSFKSISDALDLIGSIEIEDGTARIVNDN